MRNLRQLLDIKLLSQPFGATLKPEFKLKEAKLIAQIYAKLENCISVLSDMKTRRSYVYYGAVAEQIGLKTDEDEIDSIWEEDLLSRVHSEDLQRKFRLELQFFQHLKSIIVAERSNYEVVTKLRILNKAGRYMLVKHRLVYISSLPDGSAWLALCLYSGIPDHPGFSVPEGVILNNQSGDVVISDPESFNNILSSREKQILRLIKRGFKSREIASKLSLSINTINRHRQNIFEKLNVSSAMEAFRVIEATGLTL